jgi:23S rRNA pseudoU1915 N3-methylase RlmH
MAARRLTLRLSLALTAIALSPAPLAAQASGSMETGSLIPNRPAGGLGTGRGDARVISRQFAECSIKRTRGIAERYLAAPIGSKEQARLQRQVLVDDCLGAGELTLPVEVIRGALFEQLYLADYRIGPDPDLKAVPAIDYTAGYSAPVGPDAGNGIALAQFGDCVARANIADSRRLLVNLPGSAGETEAVHGLMNHLGACIPAGRKIAFSRSVLRAAIAEGLYRLMRSVDRRPGTAG